MLSSRRLRSYREVLVIGVLIGSVCFVALSPALYLIFHALRWQGALRLVEAAFLPALLLAIAAYLMTSRRAPSGPGSGDGNRPQTDDSV